MGMIRSKDRRLLLQELNAYSRFVFVVCDWEGNIEFFFFFKQMVKNNLNLRGLLLRNMSDNASRFDLIGR